MSLIQQLAWNVASIIADIIIVVTAFYLAWCVVATLHGLYVRWRGPELYPYNLVIDKRYLWKKKGKDNG